MKTQRIISIQDVKDFFASSINSMEDALGIATITVSDSIISFDFNATLLLRFDGVYADETYPLISQRFDQEFIDMLKSVINVSKQDNTETYYVRKSKEQNYHFIIKVDSKHENKIILYLICKEKLMETEEQLSLFSNVIGAGVSVFAGSTWWIDYDHYSDHFYQSDQGPKILGIDVNDNGLYNTKTFQKVREKARQVSELYDEAIQTEMEAYEAVRKNETDYFGGRTPAVTAKNDIVWVEAYGKCLLRYPDGSPRFFVAIDIYMSEVFERINQLEILHNLIDQGLLNSGVGVFYYQRHFKEGRYYFTESYNKLMSDNRVYKNETIKDILDEQEVMMKRHGQGLEKHIQAFRKTHNKVFYEGLEKYHVVIPNFKNEDTLQWIDVRTNVISKDDNGQPLLFVSINVDVTETHNRRLELEALRIKNERLQLAENLAIKARDSMIWYQSRSELQGTLKIYGNDTFNEKLGLPVSTDGMIRYKDLRKTLLMDDPSSRMMGKKLLNEIKSVFSGRQTGFKKVKAKHRHLETNEVIYLEHSIELSGKDEFNGDRMMAGMILDVTENTLYQDKIQYLADHDTLTETYNRNYFERYIRNKLPRTYSVLVFDVDGLKLINDAFGHIEGDRIIKTLAKFLKDIFDDALFIARIGGDEFVVLTEQVDYDHVTNQANQLEDAVKKYNRESTIELRVSKGGMAVNVDDITFDEAFAEAENKMYRRKLNSRNSRKSKVLSSIMETLNAKTEETKEHSNRVSELAIQTIHALGFSRASEIEDIRLLAQVHDIGKITIPDNILMKPSKLTSNEFEVIKKHCEAGYKIIRNITDSDDVCNGVLFHHEWYDGTGYPQGLKGEEIPLFARVIAVVDSFDAMTHDRIYRPKKTYAEAIKELSDHAGTQFDPNIVEKFIELLEKDA
ncbi:MAG: HD domain-containing phosphohydrolase [Candidatus Izemoplasma sp.]|nr:HD domain-containing phosphohydrolase [Candidatus Izemoplasma sp.]